MAAGGLPPAGDGPFPGLLSGTTASALRYAMFFQAIDH
jgi:hypothetical protein